MILVNVKSYGEMFAVVNYVNSRPSLTQYDYLRYEESTVVILENKSWYYKHIKQITKQITKHNDQPILTFAQFKTTYLDIGNDSEDDIHQPSHYQLPDGTQVKEHIASLTADMKGVRAWATGNAIKYLARAGKKDDIIKDLKKAQENIQIIIDDIAKEQ